MKSYIYGMVVEEDGVGPGCIEIKDGVISQFVRNQTPPAVSTAVHKYPDSCLIFPGFIDIHVHCREDVSGDENYKEDYLTAGLAALSGGVTQIADMPNNPIPPITLKTWVEKWNLTGKSVVDVLPYGGFGPDTVPFGADVPYKAFMGPSIGQLFFKDHQTLDVALARYRGLSVSFHCEDPVLLELHKGRTSHELRRPPICEIAAIKVALDLIDRHQLVGKICHVSTVAGLELIKQAKQSGVKVTCEVTPHHLYFHTGKITADNHKFLQMNPPLRSPDDCQGLLAAVNAGAIDYLASDHAPHTIKEKVAGISGVPQLDTYGSFVAWLIKVAGVAPATIWRLACHNPGQWVESFTSRKLGRLAPGYEASITVLDLTMSAADGRPLYSKSAWSPFDLRALPGSVVAVFQRGAKVVCGQFIRSPDLVQRPGP